MRTHLVLPLVLVAQAAAAAPAVEIAREPVVADIAHYTFTVPLGDTPNARIRIHRVVRERAPFWPRPTVAGILFLHGDFATFTTNFALEPTSIASYLAARDIDVWGVDRRANTAPDVADTSDFAGMTFAQGVDDTERALAIARAVRLATGSGGDRLILSGFSRGGQLAYSVAAADGARPAWERNLKGLVPIDVYAVPPPDDAVAHRFSCRSAAGERDLVAAGVVDVDNTFIIQTGQLAADAPDAPSDFSPGQTNLEWLLTFVGQTGLFFRVTPAYHLIAPVLDGDVVTGLRETLLATVEEWLIRAPRHQSMQESADGDALWCGEATVDLAQIHVPLFYLGAAGGFGDEGLYTTTLVGSRDVGQLVVRRFGPEGALEDFGHADLLYATDAPTLAWAPLAAWIRDHR